MKRLFIILSFLFCGFAFADTINLHWKNYDGTTYQNSTCTVDSDLNIPTTPPTKYGYTFTGWKLANYTPIEYLEATGTQWIDTGIKQSDYFQNLIISAVFKYNTIKSSTMLLGTGGDGKFFCFYAATDGFYVQSGVSSKRIRNKDTDKHTMLFDSAQGIISIDQENYVYTPNDANISSNIELFSRNHGLFALAQIYNISFYTSQNILIRDFIPVLDENNVPCMFDTVEGKFYYNQGTGQFIAGPIL